MKRPIHALLVGTMLLGATGVLAARAEKADKDKEAIAGEERGGRLKEKLGLTDEQAQKLKEAFKAERTVMKPLRRELRDAVNKLRDQVEDKAGDKDIQASLDRVDQARKAVQAEREKFKTGLTAFLGPTQRAKLFLHIARRHRMHRGGMGFGPERGFRHGEEE